MRTRDRVNRIFGKQRDKLHQSYQIVYRKQANAENISRKEQEVREQVTYDSFARRTLC